jgi:hypothetical protein
MSLCPLSDAVCDTICTGADGFQKGTTVGSEGYTDKVIQRVLGATLSLRRATAAEGLLLFTVRRPN